MGLATQALEQAWADVMDAGAAGARAGSTSLGLASRMKCSSALPSLSWRVRSPTRFSRVALSSIRCPASCCARLKSVTRRSTSRSTAGTDPEQGPEQRVERPVQALAVDVQLVGQGDVAGDDDLVGRFEQGRNLLDDLRGQAARGDGIAPGAWFDQRSLSSIRRCRVACTSGRGSARCLNNDWRRSGADQAGEDFETDRQVVGLAFAALGVPRGVQRAIQFGAQRSRSATARCAGSAGPVAGPGAPPATAQPRRSAP